MLVYFGMCGHAFYAYGVFLPFMCEEFGWSRYTLSGPFTLFMVFEGILGPLVGISISKFGARRNIIIGNLIAGLGLLGMAFVEEVWHVYILFGVLTGGGVAFGTFIATTTIVNNWFIKRRSLAMSLLIAAGGIGGLVMPPFISWLISSVGWQLSWTCLAGMHMVLVVIAGGILTRNRPEEMGQVPDGETDEGLQEEGTGKRGLRVYQTPVDWKVREALRTPALWLVMFFQIACSFTLGVLTLHQVAYLQDAGFTHMMASTALGLLVGMSIIGRLLCGALGTRFEGRHLAAVCLVGMTAGVIVLMNTTALPLIYLYAVLTGIGYGGVIVIGPALIGAYFGRTSYAQLMGWTAPVGILFGAGSPLLAGFIYDTTGSYIPVFWAAVAVTGVGLVAAFLARPPRLPEISANQ
jgi:MFS family permease